jgi:uncharacterized protein YdhG (YjbR/CyaY superfamily)
MKFRLYVCIVKTFNMESASKLKFKTVEEYFSVQPRPVKALLQQLRKTIQKADSQAEELISYNMPAFRLKKMLVWYAAHKEHIGFYPQPSAIETFKKELSVYKGAKGSIQFPLDKPLPLGLIRRMVEYRVAENLNRLI